MFRNYNTNVLTDRHSFEIHDMDLALANGIRRTILTDIPTVGMYGEEDVTIEIYKNNGPLHNEFLIHRIALIPICVNEEELENYEDNNMILELNVENKSNNIINITTNDIKGYLNDKELTKKDLERYFPMNNITKDYILITRLRSNEYLHFKGKVIKRTARKNASFSQVSLSNFYYIQDPSVAKKKTDILDKERSYYTNEFGDPNALMFEIEAVNNNISPKYLINKALDIIVDKLNNLILNILSESSDDVKIEQFLNITNTFEFYINNEDDTLGNIIQSYIHNTYVRSEKVYLDGIKCSYVGYICPHPLKSEMIIRITLDGDNVRRDTFIRFLETTCRNIVDDILIIKKDWNDFVTKPKAILKENIKETKVAAKVAKVAKK